MKRSVVLVLCILLLTVSVWFPAFSDSAPPRIPPGDFSPVSSSLSHNGKFAVYSGPGKTYLRPADGKAAVSSNGWALTFGTENGWTMIAYEVSPYRYRFGWIEESEASNELSFDMVPAVTERDTVFTDDPLGKRSQLALLKKGTPVTRLARMGIWAYVEAAVNGIPARGFVCSDALTYSDKAIQYADCLYPILVDGKWGYMNYQGETVIKPQWAYAGEFRGAGYAVVSEKEDNDNGTSACTDGIINKAGVYVVEPEYACVEGEDKYYFGGKDTGIIWLSREGMPDGFFDVASGCFSGMKYSSYYCKVVDDERLIPVVSREEERNWWEAVGFADRTTGELVIPYQYVLAEGTHFAEGFAYVERYTSKNDEPTPLIINEQNEPLPLPKGIIPLEYYEFSDERLVVMDTKTGLYGYIDTSGKLVIEAKFSDADHFHHGIASVEQNGERFYIDKTGRRLDASTEAVWKEENESRLGMTLFFGEKTDWGTSCGLMNRDGTILIPLEAGYSYGDDYAYGYEYYITEGLQVLIKNGIYGFLDAKGNEAIPFVWDYAEDFSNGLAFVVKDGKMAYIDDAGNIVWQQN